MAYQEQINSSVLKLETLQKEFSLTMNQYKKALASYENEISNPSQKYSTFPGNIYFALPFSKTEIVEDEAKCAALCSSDPNCKAANFYYMNSNEKQKICITSSGDSKPMPFSLPGVNFTTIYPASKTAQLYLAQVKELNTKLSTLHSQILSSLKDVDPSYQSLVKETKVEGNNLDKVYMSLLDEKNKIDQLLAEYNTLDHVQSDTSLKLESNQMFYRVLFIVAIILIFLSFRYVIRIGATQSGGGSASLYDMLFNFVLMVLLLFLAMAFQHAAGYILWAILVLAYVLVKLRIIPKFK